MQNKLIAYLSNLAIASTDQIKSQATKVTIPRKQELQKKTIVP